MQSDPIALTGMTRGMIGCQNLLCKSALAQVLSSAHPQGIFLPIRPEKSLYLPSPLPKSLSSNFAAYFPAFDA